MLKFHLLQKYDQYQSMSFWTIGSVAGIAFGLTGLILNSIEFIFIVRRKKIKHAFDLTILSLNVADFIVSICVTIIRIYLYLVLTSGNTTWYPSTFILQIGLSFSINSSMWHSVFIALQRFLATFFPNKFRIYFTKKHCIAGLIVVWMLSILQTALLYIDTTISIHIPVFLIISDACLITFYVMICCRVYYKRRQLSSAIASSCHQRNNWTLQYSALVTIAFIFCTFPYAVFNLRITVGDPILSFESQVALVVTSSILYLNPALDSVLFFIANYKQKICCQSLRCSNREEVTLNMSFQRGCCFFACCKRTEVTESTTGSQERRIDCLKMQPMNSNPAAPIDNFDANV